MQINFKNYKVKKTARFIKKNNMYIFYRGPNKNAKNWLFLEQNLKTIDFIYHKISNKIFKTILNKSIYKNIKKTINNITFLIKPKNLTISKKVLIVNLKPLFFDVLIIKINNKIYLTTQIKNSYSLNYENIKNLLFQFMATNLKKSK